MDLVDVERGRMYRYDQTMIVVVATLPGGPSEDDPDGPRDADMVMIRYRDDDHKFLVDPADLEPSPDSD